MTPILYILIGLVLGGVIAWLWAGARVRAGVSRQLAELEGRARTAEGLQGELRQQIAERQQEIHVLQTALDDARRARTEAEVRLQSTQQSLQEQKVLLEQAAARFTDTFKGLSADALSSNNQAFLHLARQSLQAIISETKGDIGKRQEAIDGLIRPLQDALARYEEQIRLMEERRQKAYGGLEEQLRILSATQQFLQQETSNLVSALRMPHVRGRWGELTLHRVVELAGMSEHCDYFEQATVTIEGGRLRPDMIVHLPAGRQIVVDAKVPLTAYLDAVAASAEEDRRVAMARHAQQVRTHMNQLAGKGYWDQFPRTPEFVVMFIPGEAFFASAVDFDRTLIEDGMVKRVVLATPTTLITLLLAIAYGWRQEKIAENAREISDLGKQLYDRLRTLAEHMGRVGTSLQKAVGAYNDMVRSSEARVFPSARKFKELGAATGEDIPLLEGIEETARLLILPELEDSGR